MKTTAPVLRPRRKSYPLNPEPVRIIVVDDEEWFVEMIKVVILEKYDMALQTFTSSRAAWQELERTAPDLLMVGGVMPQISGEEIVRGLMARRASYPIIVVSGFLSEDAVLGWFPKARNIFFLRKPFSPGQLYAELDKYFAPVQPGRR